MVVKPGPLVTVQDLGRLGYREWGVPVSGAFDQESHQLANALLANEPSAASLELTMVGGTFEATCSLAIALAGAPMSAEVHTPDGRRLRLRIPQSITLEAGSRLVIGGTPRGVRAYLAVGGGIQTRPILGSRSSETPLKEGDVLPALPGSCPARRPRDFLLPDPEEGPIRVVDGPDVDDSLLRDLVGRSFVVDRFADRMGLRVKGTDFVSTRSDPDRVSTPVAPGAIQVAGGQPMILGVACGTMGGYPHIAHVVSADLDRLAQARPGDSLVFQRIEIDEARRLDRAHRRRRASRFLKVATLASDVDWFRARHPFFESASDREKERSEGRVV